MRRAITPSAQLHGRGNTLVLGLAGNILFVAGSVEGGNPRLLAYAIEDGRLLSELKLPAPPVFDGMAVANGRLFVSTTDDRVVCLGSK
jgi:hypothetical protein